MTTILTHADGDGISSASIVKMTKKYRKSRVIFTHPMGILYDMRDLEDDLIICDIAIDTRSYEQLYNELAILTEKGYSIHYIDHHKHPGSLPPKVINIHDETVSATELVYRYFYDQLPEYATHMALMGAICDYLDGTPLMKEILHCYERRTLFLDAGLMSQGIQRIGNGYDKMRYLVDQFSYGKYPCEITELVNDALATSRQDKENRLNVLNMYQIKKNIAWVINPPASRSKAAHWIMGDSGTIIGITVRNHKHNPDIVDITIRGRNLIDLRIIIPPIANDLGGSGGGHLNATGCRIPSNQLNNFLNLVDEEIDKLKIGEVPELHKLISLE